MYLLKFTTEQERSKGQPDFNAGTNGNASNNHKNSTPMTTTITTLDRDDIYALYIKQHPLPQFNYHNPNFMKQYKEGFKIS